MGDTILLAVALQRYGDITPRAIAVRDVASDMAEFYNAPLAVLTVHVQLALMPEEEDTGQKLERFLVPLVDRGLVPHDHVDRSAASLDLCTPAEGAARPRCEA